MDGDWRSSCWPCTVRGGLLDYTYDFVAKDHGIRQDGCARGTVFPVMQVAAADASQLYVHDEFVLSWSLDGEGLEVELARSSDDERFAHVGHDFFLCGIFASRVWIDFTNSIDNSRKVYRVLGIAY
ncbi:hypothetical protein GCM10023346_46380 [Arthrobacter gyeryongensis]|uniref:Uncharacterized protein n=1 Tax=Arthrobacter gyeryongensis TaxID=1650592 RepID=A0ABP9SUT1_9MICC